MTSALRYPTMAAAALAATLLSTPAVVKAESGAMAVAACRADMLRHFPQGEVRSHRIGEIKASARRTRVDILVTTDRRYTFRCTTDNRGQILTASFDPPRRDRQLAAGQ